MPPALGTVYTTPVCGVQMFAVLAVKAPGCGTVAGLTVIATVDALLVPQALVAVTLNVPLVADALKSTVTELPVPLIVAPVPL